MIKAQWPAPKHVQAWTTTIEDGSFQASEHYPKNQINQHIIKLKENLGISSHISWLNQVHQNRCVQLPCETKNPEADACFTRKNNTLCVIRTADCLPLLITNTTGTIVAAIHAGWRGLLGGVINQCLRALNLEYSTLIVWLGPAIGPSALELNQQIYQDFIHKQPKFQQGFSITPEKKYFANLYQLAKVVLTSIGITQIYGGDYCTYHENQRFYSYRRQKEYAGRMASLIWLS